MAVVSKLDRVRLVLLSGLLTLPFLYPRHTYPLTTFHVEMLALVLGVCFVASVLPWCKKAACSSFMPPMVIFAMYVFVQSLVMLQYPERGLQFVFYVMTAVAVFWSTLQVRSIPYSPHIALLSLVVGGFIMALTGYVEHFNLGVLHIEQSERQGMMGVLAQQNTFAAYVACGLVALLAYRSIPISLVLCLGVPMALAEAYSGARIAWIFMLFVLLAAQGDRKRSWAAVILCGAYVLVRLTPEGDAVMRAPSVAESAEQAVMPRIAFLVAAWRTWLDYPIFGTGVGEFAYQMMMHLRPGDVIPGLDRHAHNIIAQLMAETGLVGAGIFIIAFLVWFKAICNVLWLPVLWLNQQLRGIVLVLSVMLAYSFTEFPLWHAQFLMLTAVMMGLLPQTATTKRSLSGAMRIGIGASCLSALIMLASITADYLRLEEFYESKRVAIAVRDSFFRGQIESVIAMSGVMRQSRATVKQEQQLIERTLHVFPKPELMCRHAELLYLLGEPEKADAVLVQMHLAHKRPGCLISQ